jgi:hypothetical protein
VRREEGGRKVMMYIVERCVTWCDSRFLSKIEGTGELPVSLSGRIEQSNNSTKVRSIVGI